MCCIYINLCRCHISLHLSSLTWSMYILECLCYVYFDSHVIYTLYSSWNKVLQYNTISPWWRFWSPFPLAGWSWFDYGYVRLTRFSDSISRLKCKHRQLLLISLANWFQLTPPRTFNWFLQLTHLNDVQPVHLVNKIRSWHRLSNAIAVNEKKMFNSINIWRIVSNVVKTFLDSVNRHQSSFRISLENSFHFISKNCAKLSHIWACFIFCRAKDLLNEKYYTTDMSKSLQYRGVQNFP